MKLISQLTMLIMMLAFSHGLHSQITIQAGVNASSWRASSGFITFETQSKAGFHIGANYSSTISPTFSFKPGVLYTQKGAKLFEFTTSSAYLEVPLMFVYQKNPERGFFGEGGLYVAFLLSANDEGRDIKDEFSSTDVGLNLGGGWDFGKMIIGVRGNIGVINISKSDGTADEGSLTNSNGQLYFAVKMN